MKIAIFVAQLEGGGAERMMVNLANGLARVGHDVFLVCGAFIGPYCSEVSAQVNIVDFKEKRVSRCVFKLYNFLKKNRPSCLISTQTHAIVTATISSRLLPIRTPFIAREATTPSMANKRSTDEKFSFFNLKRKMMKYLSKYVYKKADMFVAVSEGVKKDMVSYYNIDPSKIRVIPNPVITPDIDAKKEQEVAHSFLNERSNSIIIVGVGRIHTTKDFSTLVRAFSHVRKTHKAKLLILGDTEFNKTEFEKVQNLVTELDIKSEIDFLGFVKNPFAYLNKADVFVLSSLYEGMPGVIIQAMYCGCQIVSTNCKNGPEEILLGGEIGKLVEVGDFEEMAKQIIYINNHPVDQERLKMRALEFSEQKSVLLYLKLIEEVG